MIRADFPTLEQYIAFRNADNEYKRRWCIRNPDKVRIERARNAVRKLSKSTERQRARQAELQALLELDEDALLFIHDTCRANVRAELSALEARLQETITAHGRAVSRVGEIEG